MESKMINTLRRHGSAALRLAAAGVALFLASCGDDAVEPPAATNMSVNPASVSLSYLGETATVAAVVTDQRGQPFAAVVTWSSSAPDVFTVNTAGVVTAVSNGSGTLTASAAGLTASAAVTVRQAADTVIVVGGSGQRGVQGRVLDDSVIVRVLDRGGTAVAGATVEFAPDAGGSADPASAEADADGRAATTWTLGDAPGMQSLTARVGDQAASTVGATAVTLAESADSIQVLSGESRRAVPGHALAVVVRVVNENGEPVPGATVVFSPGGDGSDQGSLTATSAETGADGLARTEWTPGAVADPQTLRASIEGGPASAMEATVVAPRAVRVAGDASEGAAGRAISVSAQLVDAEGAPVEGSLRFEPQPGHGTVDNGDGPASVALVRTDTTATSSVRWTPMGDVAGQPTQMLSVSVAGFPRVPTLLIDLRITSGICYRTPQVVLAILLSLSSVDPLTGPECSDVTLEDLEFPFLGAMNLPGLEIASLKEWDFAGIDLFALDLTDNRLEALPAGIFSQSPNLGILLLGQNRLNASIFSEIRHLRGLQVLDLSRNLLGEIPAGALSEFAELQVLFLENAGLQALSAGTFRSLAKLVSLSLALNGELRSLDENAFQGLSALENLDLSRTGIETIEPGAFNGLSKLLLLDIGNTAGLKTLPAGAFQGLSRLEVLPLDSTAVAAIEPGAFDGMDALLHLIIERSRIGTLAVGAFRGMPQLQTLSLRDNPELATLPSGVFEGLPPGLRLLEVAHSELSAIEAGAFDGLAGLEFLVLDHNRLATWPQDAFRGPAALAGLSLSGNEIGELSAAAFAGQPRLRALRLHDNNLAAWPTAALVPLASLESLDLRDNELADLPSGTLQGLSESLQHLDLRGNPGAPFALGLAIERVGDEALSEGDEAKVRAKSADDASIPFTADVTWTASGDVVGVPEGAASLPAGAAASEPWTLSGDNNGAAGGAQVSVAANATFRSDSIFGLELVLADTLVLEFAADSTRTNRRPVAVGAIPDATLKLSEADGVVALSVDLGLYFSDPDGDSLVYEATPATDGIVDVAVADDSLKLASRSAGTTVVRIRAFDPVGFVAVQHVAVAVRSPFDVEIVYLGEVGPEHRKVFDDAAERWESILVQGLPEIDFSEIHYEANQCVDGQPAITDTITDVRIYAAIRPIDGNGQILAQAGPCALREGSLLPVLGVMEFDEADIPLLEAEPGGLEGVILHEMAHVLGLGTIWSGEYADLLRNPSVGNDGADTHFVGERAVAAFDAAGGDSYTAGAKVPVENSGVPGSADGHWREDVLVTELMTPNYNSGSDPLSAITIQSMADLGYAVDVTQADAYSLPSAHGRALAVRRCAGDQCVDLSNDIREGPIVLVGPSGRISGVLRR